MVIIPSSSVFVQCVSWASSVSLSFPLEAVQECFLQLYEGVRIY